MTGWSVVVRQGAGKMAIEWPNEAMARGSAERLRSCTGVEVLVVETSVPSPDISQPDPKWTQAVLLALANSKWPLTPSGIEAACRIKPHTTAAGELRRAVHWLARTGQIHLAASAAPGGHPRYELRK